MANYDFQAILSPLDFEHLVRDLLSRELKLPLTAFAEGKDKGKDLRYSTNESKEIIVQCKRVKSISKAQIDSELQKVIKINPEKYYFVISNDISTDKFDYIKNTFNNWMSDDSYIYTRSRLNNLLDIHNDIHQRHYKLWLNSSTIFNTLINTPLFERANSLISDLKRDYKYYVRNESLNKAIEILNENQFIIISGIPGIGKTTLAKLILWEYLQKGFEIIEIRKVIEGEQILVENSENNQVFYFDDFLGENFLKYDVIEGRSNDLIQFIKRISNSKNKILIMTTREYILNQAKEVYEKLDSSELNLAKHTLDLSSYSKRIRSLILYNHLYYSDISIDHIKSILNNDVYKHIINHKNYSPRIIEQLTAKLKNADAENYGMEFLKSLNHPLGIWNKAFNSQISEGSKITLFLLLSISGPILLVDFKKALDSLYNNGTKKRGLEFKPFDFKDYLRELENSFIKMDITNKGNHYIDFLNPSIKDFLLSVVKDDIEIIKLLLEGTIYYNQFTYTIRYLANDFIENQEIREIIDQQILNNIKSITNPTIIHLSQKESIAGINMTEKIDGLKFYYKSNTNTTLRDYIIESFNTIELERLNFIDERKYLEFYVEFKTNLKLNFIDILKKVINNISWFNSIKNLSILRKADEESFDKFKLENEALLNSKIKDSIKKELEFISTAQGLEYFKTNLSSESDLSLYSISLADFDSDFDDRYLKIEAEKQVDDEKEKLDIEIENLAEKEDEIYNEDEIFRLEMFE